MVNIINIRGLDEEDAALLEGLAARLGKRAKREEAAGLGEEDKSGFQRSAGSWRGLIEADELIADIYASRCLGVKKKEAGNA